MGHTRENQSAARELGRRIAEAGAHLIYGGGHVGLMGIVADAALEAGGDVTGIIPAHLRYAEVEHPGLTELVQVESMFARKRLMVERSDAFIALPGGLGTIDEVLDVITLAQLGQHAKPMVLVDLQGYWTPFRNLLDHVIKHGYAKDVVRNLFIVVPDLDSAMAALQEHPL